MSEPDSHDGLLRRDDFTEVQKEVNKNAGRYTSRLWFLGFAGIFISSCLAVLVTKTSAIESLLTDSKVVMMQHTERIEALRKDVDEIKTRNRYIDQGGRTTTMDRAKGEPQ